VRRPDPGVEPLTIARALRRPTYRAALASGLATGWAVRGVRVALVPLFVAVALGREPVWAGVALAAMLVWLATTEPEIRTGAPSSTG
jgi:hypothetical protein